MKAKHFRWLQKLTGIHRVHHPYLSFGWVQVWLGIGYFPWFRKRHGGRLFHKGFSAFHDCTKSGRY